jgi:hypothetical protein
MANTTSNFEFDIPSPSLIAAGHGLFGQKLPVGTKRTLTQIRRYANAANRRTERLGTHYLCEPP